MFVLSDGRVFDAGPDTTTRILEPGDVDLDDRRHEPDRRHERRDVPAEQDHEGRHLGGSGLQRRSRVRRDGAGTAVIDMSAPTPGLALDGADGVRPRRTRT